MSKEMFISSSPHETKVAVLDDDALVEVYFERDTDVGLVGGIYKGRVSRVLPGMQSAFVDIGLERDAFLYVSDFFEDADEYDKVVTEAEGRVSRYSSRAGAAEKPREAAPVALPPEAPPPSAQEPPAPEAAPEAEAAAPPPPAEQPSEPRTHDRHDRHGRRRRRRGGRFTKERFGKSEPRERSERSEERFETPAAAGDDFEILPGESLAKHRHAASEAAEAPAVAEAAAETVPETVEPRTEAEPPAEIAAPPAVEVAVEEPPVAETPAPEPPVAEEPPAAPAGLELEPTPVEPAPEPPADALPAAVVSATEAAVETETELPIGDNGKPRPLWTRIVSSVFGETPETAAGAEGAPVEATALEESPAQTASESDAQTEPTAAGEADVVIEEPASGESPEAAPGEEAAERQYTLREPHQRARFAPRRGRRGRRGRGRRESGSHEAPAGRSESPRAGNHQRAKISELLKEGQEILVQIAKEPLGRKGARITSHIALPGRYLVYMPTVDHTGVSRKIASEDERLRLRNLILENRGELSGGFIVRTAAAGQSEEELKADMNFLFRLWSDIRAKAEATKAPALLHRDLDLVQRLLRDLLTPDYKSVWVDSEIEYEGAVNFVNRCQPSLVGKVKLFTRSTPLFEEFNIQTEIEKALKPKVWLKSGGYIVINQTEALVAIDVNTGKYVGKTNRLEDTIVKTNIDAVNEIVRQIRLRDLGGIIVIDFIDMDERRNRNKVVGALEEALRRDRAPTKILSFNDFGLVAITRKRVKHSLERTLCEPCSYCSGSGWVKSVATVCHEILAEARKMAGELEGDTATLRVHPEVRRALKSQEGVVLSELEAVLGKNVIVKGDPAVHQERFEIY